MVSNVAKVYGEEGPQVGENMVGRDRRPIHQSPHGEAPPIRKELEGANFGRPSRRNLNGAGKS